MVLGAGEAAEHCGRAGPESSNPPLSFCDGKTPCAVTRCRGTHSAGMTERTCDRGRGPREAPPLRGQGAGTRAAKDVSTCPQREAHGGYKQDTFDFNIVVLRIDSSKVQKSTR